MASKKAVRSLRMIKKERKERKERKREWILGKGRKGKGK